jgi:DNA helicase-2/ATP-dependent DNA helicase PcrA
VTAGPGSGKTRVLTQRIVNLIGNGASPTEILGFTFTRNAATQMRERLEADLGEDVAKKLTITTIHGFCMRVLGTWGHLVSLKDGFSVYDDQDQLDIIKTVQADLGIKTKPQTLLREINTGKPSPKRVLAMQEFYYRLKQNNAINFRGLLDKAIYILSSHADALDHYAHRYRYVHLDEMNDTSDEDYALVRMIAGKHKNLMAVGDLDQCIYTFRGSNVQNIQHLMIDFPDHDEVVLSRSYRCTVPVCGACNELISKNLTSSGKKLITDKKGHPVVLREYDTEDEEARAIAETIKVQVENGAKYEDFAVLCRIHAIEDGILSALNSQKIPVSVAGTTLRFLDLEEVRTFHHYLMLFANARDDFAFEKVMNTPNREVRNSTKAKIRAIARQGDLSMLEAALIHFSKEPEKGDWLVQLRDISKMDFPNMLRAVYDLLHQWYDSQGLTTRAENLTRVLSFGSVWMLETPDTISVENYLSYVGGVNQQDDVTTDENTVKLMTVHASKGLEFPVVIMPACENLIFPMNNKADTPEKVEGLEEERRLFYVGMSRSMMNLIVTHARRRVFRGKDRDMEPSVFIGEAGLTEKGQVQYAP